MPTGLILITACLSLVRVWPRLQAATSSWRMFGAVVPLHVGHDRAVGGPLNARLVSRATPVNSADGAVLRRDLARTVGWAGVDPRLTGRELHDALRRAIATRRYGLALP